MRLSKPKLSKFLLDKRFSFTQINKQNLKSKMKFRFREENNLGMTRIYICDEESCQVLIGCVFV